MGVGDSGGRLLLLLPLGLLEVGPGAVSSGATLPEELGALNAVTAIAACRFVDGAVRRVHGGRVRFGGLVSEVAGLEQVLARIAGRFARAEPRPLAGRWSSCGGPLGRLERSNEWTLARAGRGWPSRRDERLLRTADWTRTLGVMTWRLRLEHLDAGRVLAVYETGFLNSWIATELSRDRDRVSIRQHPTGASDLSPRIWSCPKSTVETDRAGWRGNRLVDGFAAERAEPVGGCRQRDVELSKWLSAAWPQLATRAARQEPGRLHRSRR